MLPETPVVPIPGGEARVWRKEEESLLSRSGGICRGPGEGFEICGLCKDLSVTQELSSLDPAVQAELLNRWVVTVQELILCIFERFNEIEQGRNGSP